MKNVLTNNPPTVGTLLTAFLTATVTRVWEFVPDVVGDEVGTTGYALAVALVAVAVGKVSQRWTWPAWKVEEHGIDAEAVLRASGDR